MRRTTASVVSLLLWMVSVSLAEPPQGPLVSFLNGEKFGFKDEAGHVIIEPTFDDVGEFSSGLCPVNKGAQVDFGAILIRRLGGKWGYINTQGRLVVPFVWDDAGAFSDGFAQVHGGLTRHYIDTEGKTVITLENVSNAGDFSEGLADVHPMIRTAEDKTVERTSYIDKKGKVVFEVAGSGREFHEGLAALTVATGPPTNRQYCVGFINREGRVVIAPQFFMAYQFSDGLAAVRATKTTEYYKGDTWGYIDKTGRFVLAPCYNETHPFRTGIARVHVGGKLTDVDPHQPAVWEGGEWQLIDKCGRVLKRSHEWLEYKDAQSK